MPPLIITEFLYLLETNGQILEKLKLPSLFQFILL